MREQLEGCLVTLLVIFTIPALIFIAIIYGVYAFLAVFVTFLAVWIAIKKYRKLIANKREEEIRLYVLPAGLLLKLIKKHPTLSLADAQLVDKAMRQYFMAYHLSGHRHVAMPSEVVDDLWHEFILYTQNYARFCKAAFGKFFHHIPAVPTQAIFDAPAANKSLHQTELAAMQQQGERTESLRRTWWFACQQEYIYPKNPHKLPLLFAIDMELNIVNGRKYALDCHTDEQLANAGGTCCVGDFSGSGSGCGGGSGCSGGFSDAAGGGDGGGSDGGGCGGGCGGGGD